MNHLGFLLACLLSLENDHFIHCFIYVFFLVCMAVNVSIKISLFDVAFYRYLNFVVLILLAPASVLNNF